MKGLNWQSFVIKHCGEIGFAITGITLVMVITFLAAGNGAAAGISLCIGLFFSVPFRIAYELGVSELNSEDEEMKE